MTEQVGSAIVEEKASQPVERSRRRWALWAGAALVVALLVGAAFVGGRLLAQRNVAPVGQGVRLIRPAELPKEPPTAMGPVQKVEGKVITLEMPVGGGGVVYSGPGGAVKKEGEWTQIQVVVTQNTKIYKDIPLKPEELQKGRQRQLQVEKATLADAQVGDQIEVWGQESGRRITAEVLYIRRRFEQP